MKELAIFDQWSVCLKEIGGDESEEPLSHNGSYIRYLYFAHTVITGTRFPNEPADSSGSLSEMEIIGAFLLEVYELLEADDEYLDLSCYGFWV